MYALLDEQAATARRDLARVLRGRPSDPVEATEREITASRLRARIHALESAAHALCFGRIDRGDGTWVHVGRIGLRSGATDEPRLVDWRADAARPFYAATALAPEGLRRRRHLKTDGRAVTEVSDEILDGSEPGPDDVVGDGPLVEALSARRTGHMRAAVSTLQSEQDRIVRSPHRGVTVVQGGPGTGKTVVALHRAAYVLYAHERAAAEGVLVLGPNPRFLEYISHVLPSLGENDVVLATCATLTGRDVAPAADDVARAKGESGMAVALADAVRRRQAPPGPLRTPGDLPDLSADDVAAARAQAVGGGLAHNPAREVFKEHVVDMLTDALEREAAGALERVDEEVAAVMGRDVASLDRTVSADLANLGYDGVVGDAHDDFDPDAVRAELTADRGLDRALDAVWPRLDAEDVVREVLGVPSGGAGADQAATRDGGVVAGRWTEADVPLLDEASALVDGLPARTFGHVVVDEAQEITPMQWRMVARRCPSRSMTVVGDFAQAGQVSTVRNWDEALADIADGRTQTWTLTVSYRTTAEILGATRDLLARIAPEQRLSTAVRHGEEPRTVLVPVPASVAGTSPAGPGTAGPGDAGAVAAAVGRIVSDDAAAYPGAQVAVLCVERRVDDLTGAVAGAAQVLPASAARGLEFDAVVVVAPDEIVAARAGGERDLYVALTRPTHRLIVVEKSAGKTPR
ncbi:AAA family ATPase [Myceligenerans sp. TRM 65318]|uniref:AAA family ATPase n=2 Tax=Myceligenerans pegani TaxID=2776917 RepID=A0ABR9N176_9MICO|nr:AAA family ATPase [Myceligenerans sp. TRM 65318]MBE3019655.1 AAA family ATPase [Myceligenerans sp. TRM 65318]